MNIKRIEKESVQGDPTNLRAIQMSGDVSIYLIIVKPAGTICPCVLYRATCGRCCHRELVPHTLTFYNVRSPSILYIFPRVYPKKCV